ncbi:MAG: ArsA family ATPase [bacterium]|nr:ArsA family ATPase [bacterium]
MNGLTGLTDSSLKLILFGGKGGVGKTTCSVGTGLYLSEGLKTLLISTDPAHSLGDSLGQEIGDTVRQVKDITNLSALEISAEKALSKFKVVYESQIMKILGTSTYLDDEDIDSIFSLSIPGIDEVMGFKAIIDLINDAKFDKYIVDTAPTGHTLRLLTLPGLLDQWIKVMAKMRWKYRYTVETFAGEYNPDEGDDFILEMKKTVKRIEELLRDEKRCEFVVVTIPEEMAVLETERLINNLTKYGIAVKQLVINNVLEWNECDFCRERRKVQEKYINQIKKKFGNLQITNIPLQAQEVKGITALNNFKKLLF